MNYDIIEKIQFPDPNATTAEERTAYMTEVLRTVCETTADSQNQRINDMIQPQLANCDYDKRELAMRFHASEWELNPMGTLHGGLMTLMIDMTSGLLVRFFRASMKAVTVQLSVNFLGSVEKEDDILVHAHLDKLGKRVAFLHAEIIVEKSQKLAATATCTFM